MKIGHCGSKKTSALFSFYCHLLQCLRAKRCFNTQALSSGLGMEACVALHQADELQGIIGEIKVSVSKHSPVGFAGGRCYYIFFLFTVLVFNGVTGRLLHELLLRYEARALARCLFVSEML